MNKLTVAQMRDLEKQVTAGEISYSLMVQMINERLLSNGDKVSDEEIMNEEHREISKSHGESFVRGAKWVRSKLTPTNSIDREAFEMPTDKQLIEIAILFNDGKIEEQKLADMVGMANFILDRLHENGNIKTKSKKEIEIDCLSDNNRRK